MWPNSNTEFKTLEKAMHGSVEVMPHLRKPHTFGQTIIQSQQIHGQIIIQGKLGAQTKEPCSYAMLRIVLHCI